MAQVRFAVQGSDEQFTIEVDPPPAIGSQFGDRQRWFEVVSLDEASDAGVNAVVKPVAAPEN